MVSSGSNSQLYSNMEHRHVQAGKDQATHDDLMMMYILHTRPVPRESLLPGGGTAFVI